MEPGKWENDTSHIKYISFPLPSLPSLPIQKKPCSINIFGVTILVTNATDDATSANWKGSDNMSIWDVRKPTAHMRKLCRSLGEQYRITDIDLERVIYRDFGNGYDVEICGVNTSSTRKKANIYLWKDGLRIVERRIGVPQDEIGSTVNALYEKYSDANENGT